MANEILNELPKEVITSLWNHYSWRKAEKELLKYQQDLTRAAAEKNTKTVAAIQKTIVNLDAAKMLAVRKVAGSYCSPGIDGTVWKTAAEKYTAAVSLNKEEYKASPYRHIIVETKNGKQRNVNIPTYYDRAMQVLYSYALNPIEEATGDKKSFAFRMGRSSQDANEYVKQAISDMSVNYVVIADVKQYYQSISHKWLLDNIQMDRHVLRQFLQAGYVFYGDLFPMDEYGISIGNNISPILGNMALDGLQTYIYSQLYHYAETDFANGNMIRWADDIVVTVRDEENGRKILGIITEFLEKRGLRLSETKTKLVSLEDGFDFLSRHYVRKNGVVSVTPSANAVSLFEQGLEDVILTHNGSQKALIDKINKKLTGFATYHRVEDATNAFKHIDTFVKATLLKLCNIKHPKWSIDKIKSKYWYLDYNGEYVYALRDKVDVRIQKLSNVFIIEHKKVKTTVNSYLDIEYLEQREDEREIYNVTGKYRPVWRRQNGHCYYCGYKILADQQRAVVQINPAFGRKIDNLAYVHWQCRCSGLEYAYTDNAPVTEYDLSTSIRSLDIEDKVRKRPKFELLGDYFSKCVQPSVTLTFKEIEKIVGEPLCKTALTSPKYWYKTGENQISSSWLINGYELKRLYLDEKRITFRRTSSNGAPVDIPEVFLHGKIPYDAKCELENLMSYIKKKYGL